MTIVGALLGLIAGAGLALTVSRLPFLRRPVLEDRLAPYLRDGVRPSRLLADLDVVTPFPTLERLLRPFVVDAARRLDGALGGSASVRRRLDRLGDGSTVEEFRMRQVGWGALGGLAGVGLALLIGASRGGISPVPLLAMCVLAALSGVLMCDRDLARRVAKREERMLAELPTVAELLALSVSAGEGAAGALERVVRLGSGELSRELDRTLREARSGLPLVRALERLADRTGIPALARFVEGFVVAIERGTPLADVLRAQAVDVREAGRRALLEAGARKEIAMMIPVVFLVLPVSVLFALFPGFYGLSLSAP